MNEELKELEKQLKKTTGGGWKVHICNCGLLWLVPWVVAYPAPCRKCEQ